MKAKDMTLGAGLKESTGGLVGGWAGGCGNSSYLF